MFLKSFLHKNFAPLPDNFPLSTGTAGKMLGNQLGQFLLNCRTPVPKPRTDHHLPRCKATRPEFSALLFGKRNWFQQHWSLHRWRFLNHQSTDFAKHTPKIWPMSCPELWMQKCMLLLRVCSESCPSHLMSLCTMSASGTQNAPRSTDCWAIVTLVSLKFPCTKLGTPGAVNQMHFKCSKSTCRACRIGTIWSDQIPGSLPVGELVVDATSLAKGSERY